MELFKEPTVFLSWTSTFASSPMDDDTDEFIEWSIKDYETVQEVRKKETKIIQQTDRFKAQISSLINKINARITQLQNEIHLVQQQSQQSEKIIVRISVPYIKHHKHSFAIALPFWFCNKDLYEDKEESIKYVDKIGLIYPAWPSTQLDFLRTLSPPKVDVQRNYLQIAENDEQMKMYWERVANALDGIPRTALECYVKYTTHLIHPTTTLKKRQKETQPKKVMSILSGHVSERGWSIELEQLMVQETHIQKTVFEWFQVYRLYVMSQCERKNQAGTWTTQKDDMLQKGVELYRETKQQWVPIVSDSVDESTPSMELEETGLQHQHKDVTDAVHWSLVSKWVQMTPRQCKYRYKKLYP
jgi:hypothetical protein